MMVRFLRTYRGIYVVATAFALLMQIPLTIPEVFRIGTARYVSEVGAGVSRAFSEAWRGW